MTPSLSEAIARVEHTLYYGYNEDLLTHDIHTLIDAAKQAEAAEAWSETMTIECGVLAATALIEQMDAQGLESLSRDDIMEFAAELKSRLPAPEPKGT